MPTVGLIDKNVHLKFNRNDLLHISRWCRISRLPGFLAVRFLFLFFLMQYLLSYSFFQRIFKINFIQTILYKNDKICLKDYLLSKLKYKHQISRLFSQKSQISSLILLPYLLYNFNHGVYSISFKLSRWRGSLIRMYWIVLDRD